MPQVPVVIRRWEIVVAFVAITVAMVVGLWVVNSRVTKNQLALARAQDHAILEAERATDKAKTLALVTAQTKRQAAQHRVEDCARSQALLDYLTARQKQVPLNGDSLGHYLHYKELVLADCR